MAKWAIRTTFLGVIAYNIIYHPTNFLTLASIAGFNLDFLRPRAENAIRFITGTAANEVGRRFTNEVLQPAVNDAEQKAISLFNAAKTEATKDGPCV